MFKFLKNKVFQKTMLITAAFGISFGVTFGIANGKNRSVNKTAPRVDDNVIDEEDEGPGGRLLSSLLEYEAMDIDANIAILMEDNTKIDLNLSGEAQIKEIEDIKLLADLDANLDGTRIAGQVGYFAETLSFTLEDICYFKLETEDLLDFISMIPTYGVSLELPSSLTSLSMDSLTETISSISEEDKKTTPSGDYYYYLPFGEGEEAIEVMVLTDTEDNFKGVRVETFYYQGNRFSINAKINGISELHVVNPLYGPNADKYQDFSPVFTLFDNFYKLTKQKQLGVQIDFSLENQDEETLVYQELLDASLKMDMDLDSGVYAIDADIQENGRLHQANFAYAEQTIYAKYHNVAVSLETVTISDLFEYALHTISADTINSLFAKISESASSLDISALSSQIKDMVKNVSVSSGNVNATIDLSAFGLEDCSLINLGVDFSDNQINRIYVNRSEIKGFAFSAEVTFVDFTTPNIIKDEYVSVEPLITAAQAVLDLLDKTKFRLELSATIDNKDASKGDTTIDGGVQFELDPLRKEEGHVNVGYGYGELDIVDPDGYNHNIKADMKSVQEILFSYNDTLNGKFNIQTLKDLYALVKQLVEDKDDHFVELFGELLEKFSSSPLAMAIAGDYGLLLSYDIIDNLQITSTGLSCDINFAIFGMDDVKPHIALTYSRTQVEDDVVCLLDSLTITDLDLGDQVISATIRLRDFNDSLESSRLDPSEVYLDFSDIKVLLELGINTSRFNYYHVSLVANLTLTALSLDIKDVEVPIDMKIRNDKGKVQVAAEIEVPIIKVLLVPVNGAPDGYTNSSNRHVSFYYTSEDNAFYIHRTETTHKSVLLIPTKTGTYTLNEKLSVDYFLDNILEILLADVMGFGDTVMNLIENSAEESSGKQIAYEKILEDFYYNKTDNYFSFGINVNELANTTVFSATTLKIYADPNTNQLTGIKANTTISVGLKIKLGVDVDLLDAEETLSDSNRLSALESYVSAHINDAENQKYISFN